LFDELPNLCDSSDIVGMVKSGRIGWALHVARVGELRDKYTILVGDVGRGDNLEDGDNIKIEVRETCWEFVDWISQAEDGDQWRALVSAVMSLQVP
jgi:hypothetical protein